MVNAPKANISKICSFLNCKFDLTLTDISQLKDNEGRFWKQNSNFKNDIKTSFNKNSINRWNSKLSNKEIKSLELFTIDRMKKFSYFPKNDINNLKNYNHDEYLQYQFKSLAKWIKPLYKNFSKKNMIDFINFEKLRLNLINYKDINFRTKKNLHIPWW